MRDGDDEFKDATPLVTHLQKKTNKAFRRKAQNGEDQQDSRETGIFAGTFQR